MRTQYLTIFAFGLFCISCAGTPGHIANDNTVQIEDENIAEVPLANETTTVSVTSVELNVDSTLTLQAQASTQLMLTVITSSGNYYYNVVDLFEEEGLSGRIVWFANNDSIASVSSTGLVTAISTGQTTIKADLLGHSVTINVVVSEPEVPTLVELNFHTENLSSNDSLAFTPTLDAIFSDGTTIEDFTAADSTLDCTLIFSSSQTSVATIDSSSGLVTPLANGVTNLNVACDSIASYTVLTVSGLSTSVAPSARETVMSVTVTNDTSNWIVGETKTLTANVELDSGIVENISGRFVSPNGRLMRLSWHSSDSSIISVSRGEASLVGYGSATLTAFIRGVSGETEVNVYQSSDALTWDDQFLLSTDSYNLSYGTNGGYGDPWFPDPIVTGPPVSGGTHVVSFGGGGNLLIELNGREIVDGPGEDFTIFENAVNNSYYGKYAERATIGVSEDGITFEYFDCDAFDAEEIYAGCAGVTPVNAAENPLDPSVSGGDSFDLEDLGLERVRFISIQDEDTCTPSDPTYYSSTGSVMCATSGQQGFDLDAISFIHAQYF